MGGWKRAPVAAGVIPPRERGARYLQAVPEDGVHALRHAYASVLLDAGESVKALSEYPGHSDPGFTPRTYTHLLPSSEARTRKAIDDAFTDAEPQGEGEGKGTSAPPAKPMCPGRLTTPLRHGEGRGPKDPARPPRNPGSGPHQAVRLMPRLVQPVAEVLPLVQRLNEAGH